MDKKDKDMLSFMDTKAFRRGIGVGILIINMMLLYGGYIATTNFLEHKDMLEKHPCDYCEELGGNCFIPQSNRFIPEFDMGINITFDNDNETFEED
tara:strand:+ start:189 stop:476 length:288 start_codon:yes stop_codon:yes gene_type:complete